MDSSIRTSEPPSTQPDLFGANPVLPFHRNTEGAAREATREAAEHMREGAPTLRARALESIRRAGVVGRTADEIAEELGVSVLALRPRATELVQLGLARRSGERRRNASGVSASVLVMP